MRKRDIGILQQRVSDAIEILFNNNVKATQIGNVQVYIDSSNTLNISVRLNDK